MNADKLLQLREGFGNAASGVFGHSSFRGGKLADALELGSFAHIKPMFCISRNTKESLINSSIRHVVMLARLGPS